MCTYRDLCEDVEEKRDDREIQTDSSPTESLLQVLWHSDHLLKKNNIQNNFLQCSVTHTSQTLSYTQYKRNSPQRSDTPERTAIPAAAQ